MKKKPGKFSQQKHITLLKDKFQYFLRNTTYQCWKNMCITRPIFSAREIQMWGSEKLVMVPGGAKTTVYYAEILCF